MTSDGGDWLGSIRAGFARITGVFNKELRDKDLDEELQFHIDMLTEQYEAKGMSNSDARALALREFGRVTGVKEKYRRQRGIPQLEAAAADLWYAVRSYKKSPLFAATVVTILGLGIGGTATMFSLIDTVVLQPLPYPDSDRLYTIFEQDSTGGFQLASYPTFRDWHEQSTAFDRLAYIRGAGAQYQLDGRAGMMLAAFVSEDFFPTLDVAPLVGRQLLADDFVGAGNHVVVLSNATWHRAFGGNADVVGRSITLSGISYTVVGVMPKTFTFPNWGLADTDVWLPIHTMGDSDRAALDQRGFHADSRVLTRLAPGVLLEQAQAEMDAIAGRLAAAYPTQSGRWTSVRIRSAKDLVIGQTRAPLLLLGGGVIGVLIICCVNLANVYLVQGAARTQEFAIRVALGAGRQRVWAQLVTETLVLTLCGGVLGVIVATWVVELVRTRASASFARASEIGMAWPVVGVAIALCAAAALIFAAVAARRVLTPYLADSLRNRSESTRSRRRGRLPAFLLIAQVALTVILLVGAGLLTRTFLRLTSVEVGFNPTNLVVTTIHPPAAVNENAADAVALFDRVADGIEALPGVERVALINHSPLAGGFLPSRAAIGQVPTGSAEDIQVVYVVVSDEYFSLMGIPIVEGREFTEDDCRGPAGPLIVSEALAAAWGESSPVGSRLGVLKASRIRTDFGEPILGTVIGVVSDVSQIALTFRPLPIVYVPYTHDVWAMMAAVVRTAVSPGRLVADIDEAVNAVDPAIPLDGPGLGARSMETFVGDSMAQQRMNAGLVSAFAVVALALAAIGVYGVTSYTVALATREIGIRMALGAAPARVLRTVIGRVTVVAVVGLTLGLGGALGLTRLITSLLFQVQPTDPATFVGVALVLFSVIAFAGYVPARRAASVDPMVVLKEA